MLELDGVEVVRHAVVADALATLRSASTTVSEFRHALRQVARGLVYEGTRDLPAVDEQIATPLETATVHRLSGPVVVIPILRAGLGLLHEFLELVPGAAAGFIGLKRDERTLEPREYYRNLPPLEGATLFVLDPMVATGGSVRASLRALAGTSLRSITLLSVVAAPEGLAAIRSEFAGVRIIAAAVDRGLNDAGYIVPGLGDAGDRLWATP